MMDLPFSFILDPLTTIFLKGQGQLSSLYELQTIYFLEAYNLKWQRGREYSKYFGGGLFQNRWAQLGTWHPVMSNTGIMDPHQIYSRAVPNKDLHVDNKCRSLLGDAFLYMFIGKPVTLPPTGHSPLAQDLNCLEMVPVAINGTSKQILLGSKIRTFLKSLFSHTIVAIILNCDGMQTLETTLISLSTSQLCYKSLSLFLHPPPFFRVANRRKSTAAFGPLRALWQKSAAARAHACHAASR